MLYLRSFVHTSPVPVDCTVCSIILEPLTPYRVVEEEPTRDVNDESLEILEAFFTVCNRCYRNLTDAAAKFDLDVRQREPSEQIRFFEDASMKPKDF